MGSDAKGSRRYNDLAGEYGDLQYVYVYAVLHCMGMGQLSRIWACSFLLTPPKLQPEQVTPHKYTHTHTHTLPPLPPHASTIGLGLTTHTLLTHKHTQAKAPSPPPATNLFTCPACAATTRMI